MTQLVTGEEFLSLLTRFQHTAFRLELRDRYNVPAERERWEAFLSGDNDHTGTAQHRADACPG
ncbi:DUF6879 family protein [Sphaerisporangium perillae]|uniref:DUF6879 family protein n=1 Tax=Sphaerisporangium perillae TaxID=2935860 RepID=UPI00200E7EFE|nr:DUF6879 family protein [Sphaerisporangium perillae]